MLLVCPLLSVAQNIALYEQFNGQYDFTFVGNTLNPSENNVTPICTINTSSSAVLNLAAGNAIERAYLYWAGSGTGDDAIKLNGQDINPLRNFDLIANTDGTDRPYFSNFADVTALVQATGNGSYTVSEFDLTTVIQNGSDYCDNKTNFGGWAIIVFYSNPGLPLNQLNLYDGLQYVPQNITINLPSLNVVDNIGAKIGFVAWEGDNAIANSEDLTINGNLLFNTLNPEGNAFNGTNSVTGVSNLYNMDLDIYDIQNMINIGDESAEIRLESEQDFVMINAIVTKLNSKMPDATVTAQNIIQQCNSLTVQFDYTVYNVNSTDVLPAGVPVSVFVDGDFVTSFTTANILPIGGSESGTISITLPAGTGEDFELMLIADYLNGNGTVTETNEANNSFMVRVERWLSPLLAQPSDVTACETDNGTGVGFFDFSSYAESLKNEPTDVVTFYLTAAEAGLPGIPISNTTNFLSTVQNQEIFVRLQDENGCFTIDSFHLVAIDCLFPDATITAQNLVQACNSRVISVDYTVSNLNSGDVLPAGTPISIYVNDEFLEYTETLLPIPIGGSEEGSITLTIPDEVPLDFNLVFVVDDDGTGTGIIVEADENNNIFTLPVSLWVSPALADPADLVSCNEGFGKGTFDFSGYEESLKTEATDIVTFYNSATEAEQEINEIINTTDFETQSNPQEVFVRLETEHGCYTIGSFMLKTMLCPPETYNYVTPNGDGINDSFFVKGLRNVFLNFKMSIYNRWGNLVWTGDHSAPDWDGIANEDKVGSAHTTVPAGTYYFVLELNEPDYPTPIVGWVYVTK
jgi:gliding motility-associated-like protein